MRHNGHRGMSAQVQRALGLRDAREPQRHIDALNCKACGKSIRFEFNAIGQMVERCGGCGRAKLYRGAPMLTRDDKVIEQGLNTNGNWDGRNSGYGKRKPEADGKET